MNYVVVLMGVVCGGAIGYAAGHIHGYELALLKWRRDRLSAHLDRVRADRASHFLRGFDEYVPGSREATNDGGAPVAAEELAAYLRVVARDDR